MTHLIVGIDWALRLTGGAVWVAVAWAVLSGQVRYRIQRHDGDDT